MYTKSWFTTKFMMISSPERVFKISRNSILNMTVETCNQKILTWLKDSLIKFKWGGGYVSTNYIQKDKNRPVLSLPNIVMFRHLVFSNNYTGIGPVVLVLVVSYNNILWISIMHSEVRNITLESNWFYHCTAEIVE